VTRAAETRADRAPMIGQYPLASKLLATLAMKRFLWVAVLACPLAGAAGPDAAARAMLERLDGVPWNSRYAASRRQAACGPRVPVQTDVYATEEWTAHCADVRDGVIRESFYYVFGEPARSALLRVDLRLADESPATTAALLAALTAKLTRDFGAPDHAPELFEIGFRHIGLGQPVAGDHWRSGERDYFLHANQTGVTPMGVRRGVQLIVMERRLLEERARDDFIRRAEGFGPAFGESGLALQRLKTEIGEPFMAEIDAQWKTPAEREAWTRRIHRDLLDLLRPAASRDLRALRLLAADALVAKLALLLVDSPPGRTGEARATAGIRRQLAGYGVTLGHTMHDGRLAYGRDLLWRVWREFPDTGAGELAFLELECRGWDTSARIGCPTNPDLFREVIARGTAYLAGHPKSSVRMQVSYAVAVAYESWWSIAHAPAGDAFIGAPPYPRRASNARLAGEARTHAIEYYRRVVRMAPASPEAAAALRRLPRLELDLDTGQRQFFCSYC
jgi:hypothetical protein